MLVNNIQYSYLKNGAWNAFSGTSETAMDGIKIQTPKSSPYFLRYRTWNSGKSDWYSRVDSNADDYAGAPNRPIQRLQIQVYGTDGTKITEKIVVMYRARVAGRWLPWVSNAEPEWMQSVHAKYNLGGTIDTNSYYAGNAGQNMDGIEILVYEEGMLGDYTGGEVGASALQYMFGSLDNWQSFDNSFYAEQIDGIKIQTAANKGYYLQYRTKNEGKSDWYPFVKSTGTAYNDYAGYPGKAIQLLEIQAYKNDGTRLRSGVIVMYRVSIEGRWLPWVSNADPEWMRDMQSKHSLGGTLSVNSTYAGNAGQKIDGVEIRIFEDDTENAGSGGSVGTFPGTESGASLQYMTDSLSNWTSFGGTVLADRIDGIKIRTDTDKPYYLSYRSWNAGKSNYYPYVDSRGTAYNDYAGYPGKPIQLLNIYAYANDGTKLREGVVVMYRVHVDNRWLPWVSNANPDWMVSVQEKYDLGGTLDTKSTYAGNKGQNINGVEIHIFEENGTGGGTITPVGKYKIIQNVPFISQNNKYPTGCESVSTVMALQYAGVDMTVENFIDNYLDKGSNKSFDPNICFGGDPYSTSGYGCYSPVIKKALDRILKGSLLYAKEVQGKSIEYLCSEYIDRDIPVVFWATQRMDPPRKSTRIPYKDRYIQWISPMHCLLLIGYDDEHYIFNDPQKHALTYYSKDAVETAYAGLFKQALVIQNKIDALNRLDRQRLSRTYYFVNQLEDSNLFSRDYNDYLALACLQLLYVYYYDQQDFEKTDFLYDEMLNLRKMNPSYRIIYADFLDNNGEFDLGYQYYAKGRKTTKIFYNRTLYFSKQKIQDMHKADDWTVFMTSLIPGFGTFFATLMACCIADEQNQEASIASEIIQGGISVVKDVLFGQLVKALKIPEFAYSALSALYDFCNTAYDTAGETRETYVRDGVTLQDGDSYVEVSLEYDMGVERHDFRFYFRNGYPYVTNLPQYTVRWDTDSRGKGVARQKAEAYSAEGYVPSEKHNPRGPYWPLDN